VSRVAVLHQDDRVRELYRTVLQSRGHGVLATTVDMGVDDPDIRGCDLVVVQASDGEGGLRRLTPLLTELTGPIVCMDDDPDPTRDRWFASAGVVTVLHGPVSLRRLVDTVETHLPAARGSGSTGAVRNAQVQHDSARPTLRVDARGAIDRRGRHLLLAAEDLEVALHCFPRSRGLRVRGKVIGAPHPVLARVALVHPDGLIETRTDALGRFDLEPVTPGSSTLDISGRDWSLQAAVDLASA
jgi:DNA-binding response OmpR family regulator